MSREERYSRQKELVPEEFQRKRVMIVGVGAGGRATALQLATMGLQHGVLIDFDIVEEPNLGSQGYPPSSLGKGKVGVMYHEIASLGLHWETRNRHFNARQDIPRTEVLFSCVDSMKVRAEMFHAFTRLENEIFIDSRVRGDTIRILTAYNEATRAHYESTLYTDDEAYVGACTNPMTFYAANVAAGLRIAAYVQYLRGMLPPAEVLVNLLAWEMQVERK